MLSYGIAQCIIRIFYGSIQAVGLAFLSQQLAIVFHPCCPAQWGGLEIVGHLDNGNAQTAYLLKVLSFVW